MSILRKRKMIDRIEVQSGKRPLENDENVQGKVQKQSDGSGRVGVVLSIGNSSASADEQPGHQHHAGDNSDFDDSLTLGQCMSILRKRKMIDKIEVQSGKMPLENDENVQCKVQKQSDGSGRVGVVLSIGNSSASVNEQAGHQHHAGDNSDFDDSLTLGQCMSILRKRKMIDRIEVQSGKRPLENDENVQCKVQKQSDGSGRVGVVLSIEK